MSLKSILVKSRWYVAVGVVLFVVAIVGVWQISKSRTFQFYGGLVTRVETAEPVVALTFDDGPTDEGVDEILPVLSSTGVRATFFVTGDELSRSPEAGTGIDSAGTRTHETDRCCYLLLRRPSPRGDGRLFR